MDGHSDTFHRVHHPSDFDDAFSAGDLNEFASHFSPEAIREDIARARARARHVHSKAVFESQNLSVSMLDIDGHDGQSSPQTPYPLSPVLSDQFSQISLEDPAGEPASPPIPNTEDENPQIDSTKDIPATTTQANCVPSPLEPPDEEHEQSHTPQSSYSQYPLPSAQSTQSLPPPEAPHPSPTPRPLSATPEVPVPSPTSETHSRSNSASSPASPSQKHFGHRPNRSTGPSALEKVRSQTRPVFLPPKPREEDDKHMAAWRSMMKSSRVAAEKKRKALQQRRLAREKSIEESLHIWEKEIVPDWRVVHKNPSLRKLWWKGIPSKLRASMWERAVGNSLSLSKDHYRISLSRAKKALSSKVFPQDSLEMIEKDILTTLPSLHIFHPQTGPLYEELKEMLCAWVVARSDEGLGYTPGAARIAAMLLINMPVQQGFVAMRNLLDRHCLRSFYGGEGAQEDVNMNIYLTWIENTDRSQYQVEAYYRIFDTLLADGMPKIYFNFKQHQIVPSAYLKDWLLPLFLDHLPFEACARIWDVIVLEGDSFLYRASLGILAVLEPRLFFPDRKELMELLKGENRPALEVARREGRPLDGSKYEVYGVDEETLWERIDQMDDWWKESTWTRLLQRELPDM
ncbi:hypothetical protein C0995_012962 [Termitomyces sp. Mi166|nr:hypothetical protein C0995_012962 [Termitomyces sp. Mi166\